MKPSDLRVELERLHPASFGWALWCCDHQGDEAQEVLQTAYLKVMDGTATFGDHSSLRTWFFGVVRHTAAERRRRRWVREQLLERWWTREPAVMSAPDPETSASRSESSQALLQALVELPKRQREVLHLVFYQDLTVEEAARVLKISLGTARTHFERAKSKLRTMLTLEEGQHAQR